MNNKLSVLLVTIFAISNLAQAAEPGIMGKIKEAFTGTSKVQPKEMKAAKVAKKPKLSGTERWNQVISALKKTGAPQDSWIMGWAHKNLRRAERWSGKAGKERRAHRKKTREERAVARKARKASKARGARAKAPKRARAPRAVERPVAMPA